jgi:hypothetical protein
MQSHLTPVPELYVSYDSAQKLKMEAADLPSWDLTPRQICDLELLMNGGFNPLKGFMGQADYDSVVDNMRWPTARSGRCRSRWTCPRPSPTRSSPAGHRAARRRGRDPRHPVGHRQVEPDKAREAEKVFGADDIAHPAVYYLHNTAGPVYLGGPSPASSRRPLRFPRPPRHAERAARLFPQARLAPRRGLPDPQPAAPRAPGTDLPRRARGAGEPADPPRGRHDQTRRRGPFHPRALLRGGARQVPLGHHDHEPSEPRHAHGRPARGGLARADPQEPRLHPHDRRPRPRGPGQELRRGGFLRPL